MYYLPFYFLAVKGFPAIQSGVSFIAMALPQLVGIVVSGALISKLGVYVSEFSGLTYLTPAQVPVIIIGQIIAAVGAGLLIMLVPGTGTEYSCLGRVLGYSRSWSRHWDQCSPPCYPSSFR